MDKVYVIEGLGDVYVCGVSPRPGGQHEPSVVIRRRRVVVVVVVASIGRGTRRGCCVYRLRVFACSVCFGVFGGVSVSARAVSRHGHGDDGARRARGNGVVVVVERASWCATRA